MKKLFLSSSFADVAWLLPDFAGSELKGKTVSFIPTASIPEEADFYVESARQVLRELGLIVDELELTTADSTEISAGLAKSDYIYVSGGNVFFLLRELKRTGADKIIREQIALGKPYIGESAGAMVLSPDIEPARHMDDPGLAPDLNDFKALGQVDFYFVPHLHCPYFGEAVEKIISEYGKILPLKGASNSQAITVVGGEVKIVE